MQEKSTLQAKIADLEKSSNAATDLQTKLSAAEKDLESAKSDAAAASKKAEQLTAAETKLEQAEQARSEAEKKIAALESQLKEHSATSEMKEITSSNKVEDATPTTNGAAEDTASVPEEKTTPAPVSAAAA